MATKEQTENQISQLLSELGDAEQYKFFVPGWTEQDSAMAIRWMRSQLWEGFFVAYRIDHKTRRVFFKYWEFGDNEPSWPE